jgi:hypothetical protein
MCLIELNQTKRIHHHPWCGHDADVLGWGVTKPLNMVGAKPLITMVTPVFLNNCVAEGVLDLVQSYVG